MAARVTTAHKWLQLDHATIIEYNRADCIATIRGAKALTAALRNSGQEHFYRTRTWATLPSVLAMQARGLPYDPARRTAYRRKLRAELRETDDELRRLYRETHDTTPVRVACAYQTMLWLNPDLCPTWPGWFGPRPAKRLKGKPAKPAKFNRKGVLTRAAQPAQPGRISRRPAPFTKSEWARLSKGISVAIKDKSGKQVGGYNPGSDAQNRKWLFGTLGLRPSTKTTTGAPSVNQDALNRILQRKPSSKAEAERIRVATPVLHGLMHRARLEQIDQQYLDPEVVTYGLDGANSETASGGMPIQSTPHEGTVSAGRGVGVSEPASALATGPNQASPHGTPSAPRRHVRPPGYYVFPRVKLDFQRGGRHSLADPPAHSWPKEIRHLVAAPPGYVIVGADYSAVESRVFVHLTDDTIDRHTFEMFDKTHDKLWDIHVRTACDLLQEDPETLVAMASVNKERYDGSRNLAKTFRYGVIQYGGHPATAQTKVFCACPKCEAHLPPTLELDAAAKIAQSRRWFAAHPNVLNWRSEASARAYRDRYIENPYGRRLYLTAPWNDELERFVWNWHAQSTAREIIRDAEIASHAAGLPTIFQHHDALYMMVREDEAHDAARELVSIMEQPSEPLAGIIFPVDCEWGPSWGELGHMDLAA